MSNIASFCFVIRNKLTPTSINEFLFPKTTIRIDIFNGETDIEVQYIFTDLEKSSPILINSNSFYSVDLISKGLIIKNLSNTTNNNIQVIAWINTQEVK